MNYNEALQYLEQGEISACKDYFRDNGYKLEYGYTLMLSDNHDEAEKIFNMISSLRADWALKLIPIMQGYLDNIPTYFQIRNFLEIDINLLFKASQKNYVEYILGAADSFQSVNTESYKFLGRVLLKNGYMNASKIFLDKSSDVCWRDPELQYLYVEYYLMNNDIANACKAVDNCLRVSPEYYPAISMQKKLKTIDRQT